MDITALSIPGCFAVKPMVSRDERGLFVKTFHSTTFGKAGIRCDFREQYYSISRRGVLRGMHFQAPPHDHEKLVCCLAGRTLDVILDLRRGSQSFGKTISLTLDSGDSCGVYVARGCAHGFLSLVDDTVLLYNVTSEYAPDFDTGIRWDTIPFEWPLKSPTISKRDQGFPKLSEFLSPFTFRA